MGTDPAFIRVSPHLYLRYPASDTPMTKKLIVDDTDSPIIGRGSIIALLTFAIAFGLIAVWPFTPPYDSLTREEAHIEKVWKSSLASTTTSLKTISGREVQCWYGKTGGCYPETMKTFQENKTPVIVWHDGESVYQLIAQEEIILSYEHSHNGRWFSVAVSIGSLLVALIQIGILKGLIGAATTKENQ